MPMNIKPLDSGILCMWPVCPPVRQSCLGVPEATDPRFMRLFCYGLFDFLRPMDFPHKPLEKYTETLHKHHGYLLKSHLTPVNPQRFPTQNQQPWAVRAHHNPEYGPNKATPTQTLTNYIKPTRACNNLTKA